MPDALGAENSICAACGARFTCGVVAGSQTCWCMDKPAGLAVPDAGAARCYCPDCLGKQVIERRDESVPAT